MKNCGERRTVLIEKLVAGGAGLGRLDGRVVFVPFTIPGEEVEVETTETRKDFLRAKLVAVLKASPSRIAPVCPHFTVCGGCDLQHTAYPAQLEFKRALFVDAFRRIAGVGLRLPEISASDPWGYRCRVQVHASAGGTGFKEAGSSRVVPVDSCPVASPEVNDFLKDASVRGLRSPRDRLSVFGWGGRWYREDSEDPARVVVGGRAFRFSAGCFFQSNPSALESLVAFALSGMKEGGRALDLYGGVGTFAVFLADRFERVTLVERDELSASWARRNLEGTRVDVFAGSAEAWLGTEAAREAVEAVLVDPPRTGLSAEVADFLGRVRPKRLVYVSCDAATLARDVLRLSALGFGLGECRVFDFYPQTAHVESVCVFGLG